jgi:hypothetical protein
MVRTNEGTGSIEALWTTQNVEREYLKEITQLYGNKPHMRGMNTPNLRAAADVLLEPFQRRSVC